MAALLPALRGGLVNALVVTEEVAEVLVDTTEDVARTPASRPTPP